MTWPQYAVSCWIGHSIEVSGRHYVNDVPDALFDEAAGLDGAGAAQNAAQNPHEKSRNDVKRDEVASVVPIAKSRHFETLQESSTHFTNAQKWSRGESSFWTLRL